MFKKMYIRLYVNCSLFLSEFNKAPIFSIDFRETLTYKSFMKIRPVGAELFHADRQTDGRK
jgi:hypothetical protein